MNRFLVVIILCMMAVLCSAQLPVGTVRKPIVTDASGNVVSTPIVVSNQWIMVPAPTVSNHLARIMDVTNAASVSASITNTTDNVPWLDLTTASKIATLSTNTTKLAIASYTDNNAFGLTNFPPALTNGFVTMAVTNGLVGSSRTLTAGLGLSGGGDLSADRTFAINPAIVLTNGMNISVGTVNGLSTANFATNIANSFGLTIGGTGGNSYTIGVDPAIVLTNGMNVTVGTVNGLSTPNFLTNFLTTVPWLAVTGTGGNSYTLSTNAVKIAINTNTDNNGTGITNLSLTSGVTGVLPIANGGTGVNTTQLTGSWTNTIDFTVNGNTVLGDSLGDTVMFNASSINSLTNLNWDTNTFYIDVINNRIGLGTNAPVSRLHVNGNATIETNLNVKSLNLSMVTTISNYTASIADYGIMCLCTNGNLGVSLPSAASSSGRMFFIKKVDSTGASARVIATSGNTIDGVSTQSLTLPYQSIVIVSDGGTNWYQQ